MDGAFRTASSKGFEWGKAKGHAEGMAEGMEKGVAKGKAETVIIGYGQFQPQVAAC